MLFEAILISTHRIHLSDKIRTFLQIITKYLFLELSEEFHTDPLATVNELSVFDSLKFFLYIERRQHGYVDCL